MQRQAFLNQGSIGCWSKRAFLLTTLSVTAAGRNVVAQEPAPVKIPRPVKFTDRAVRPAVLVVQPRSTEATAPQIEVSTSEVRPDAPAVAGARLTLDAGRGAPRGTRFSWFQTEGPPLEIGDPSRPSIEVTIPANAERLGFILVAARPELVRVIRVIVPIEGDPSRWSWGARPTGKAKADAGDDQVGLVGRRVTLNGSKSHPGDGKNARWLQISGPLVTSPQQQGAFFSFIPTSPALYRFVLMVAGDGELSEPDEVTVLVGSPPTGTGSLATPPAATFQPFAPPLAPPMTPEQILSASVPKLAGGTRVVSDVADAMDAIAQRATLYESFAALQSELARRLDVVIPAEAAARTAWTDDVFAPLTAYSTARLLALGLDIRRPQDLTKPLTAAQQKVVGDHFESLARAFRAVSAAR